MPKGISLSDDKKHMIWSYFNSGKSSDECHKYLFLDSEAACTKKHIQKLYRLFANQAKENEKYQYLTNNNHRGVKRGSSSSVQWYDGLVESIHLNNPTGKVFNLRLELGELLGDDTTSIHKLPSESSVGRALARCKAKRKRCTFLSDAQDPVQIYDHMERMRVVEVDDIVNFDETSANSAKFRPIYGRGDGEVVVNEWRIGAKTYSAIAAMTTLGFLPCTKIYDVACDSSTIRDFLTGLEPFLQLHKSVGLFDNATVNTCENSLQVIDRVFNERWARNAPHSPRLAPIERGFSLVWNLVQQKWQEAQQNPIRVLEECFAYYQVGAPGGLLCSSFFNVYRRNRNEACVNSS